MEKPFQKLLTSHPGPQTSRKQLGDQAEELALAYLRQAGLSVLQRNYRTQGRGGGEIDLIMRESDGTCVFVEVRSRRSMAYGGAAASVSVTKRRRILFAAQCFLLARGQQWPCRFDVVCVQDGQVQWLKAAFDAG